MCGSYNRSVYTYKRFCTVDIIMQYNYICLCCTKKNLENILAIEITPKESQLQIAKIKYEENTGFFLNGPLFATGMKNNCLNVQCTCLSIFKWEFFTCLSFTDSIVHVHAIGPLQMYHFIKKHFFRVYWVKCGFIWIFQRFYSLWRISFRSLTLFNCLNQKLM